MFLYLVQHGEAKKEQEDSARPLSEKGLMDVRRTAAYLSGLHIKIDEIFHSGKLRAKQTAEILSETLVPANGLSITDGLAPSDDPAIWVERLKDVKNDIILAGHLPHLGKLTSSLLCGDSNKNIVAFRMAGVVCLKRDDDKVWSLQWMVIPEIM
ncbi:MAG TPA: phosphohistidine phosphatase SixA [Thermodesulfovibrionia bacterium]|nr:phosphohistidine phosphatase SixA [Thermodesulfovibrionia bacterium]